MAAVCLLVENVAVITGEDDTAVNSGDEKRDVGVEEDGGGSKENVGDEVDIGVVGKLEVEDDDEEEECRPA